MDALSIIIVALIVIAVLVPIIIIGQQKIVYECHDSDSESDDESNKNSEDIKDIKRRLDVQDQYDRRQDYIDAVNNSRINSIFAARHHNRRQRHRRHRRHHD